ncbi:adenylate/guanylate cyclase domain-containing protein [Streptomyces sp. NPDC054884]|uniref:adenylate/guanylate cyclase domain-containing protein n=1 Tax=Streptomyces sp. ME08-AFT2 TaxID=3028683 RepID=UPI0029B7147F|nr:adenylate/guanylate cyclase domain-containing protein [Streptomyces sp. ME08-AFT2]MDX3313357.1 adenylate/guanylate cyclase domain-containing protein [Streptomyces sp. ME08-AFT2]
MATQLREAFAEPQSREARTVLFIDQVGSTAMKEQQPEASWLPALGWLYDTVTALAVQADPEAEIKYLGDGIMITFDSDRATDAVNVAVSVQEAVHDANQGRTGARGVIDFNCSIGVGTGSVVAFTTPTGGHDYVGTVVDKAKRLCDAASPKAIFVDRATASAANVMKIASRLGIALGRAPEQYQGDVQRAPLKGFDQPVEYYEILWDQQLYGLKSEAVTRNTDRMRQSPSSSSSPPGTTRLPVERSAGKRQPAHDKRQGTQGSQGTQDKRQGMQDKRQGALEERHSGEVTCWKPDANFGFVRDSRSGEDFYFRAGHLVYPEDAGESLRVGSRIVFVATGRVDGERTRHAVGILLVDDYAEGTLKLPEGKAHGWLRVQDRLGNSHHVFTPRSAVQRFAPGTLLSFKVAANEKGGLAEEIEEPVEEDAA